MVVKKYNRRIRRIKRTVCGFCTEKKVPDYKDTGLLKGFVTERGKIIERDRSGVCPKHQRLLTKAIKRARHLALLPFLNRL